MRTASGAKTGGLQTSALALGLAAAAIELLEDEAARRPDLVGRCHRRQGADLTT